MEIRHNKIAIKAYAISEYTVLERVIEDNKQRCKYVGCELKIIIGNKDAEKIQIGDYISVYTFNRYKVIEKQEIEGQSLMNIKAINY